MVSMFRKAFRLLKRSGGFKILISRLKIRRISTHRSYGFKLWPLGADVLEVHPEDLVITKTERELALCFNRNHELERYAYSAPVRIAWFMPDFEAGSGGHTTAFRCQKFLKSEFGIESANVVYPGRSSAHDPEKMKKFYNAKALSCYPSVYDQTPFLQTVDEIIEYPVRMATNWASVYGVIKQPGGLLRSYFIQDFEPYFYGQGARARFARESYALGLYPICAGPWIPKKLGLNAQDNNFTSFNLSTELDLYQEVPNQKRRGICFYIRAHTERRGYELAIGVITYLRKYRADISLFTIGNSPDELSWMEGVHHYGSRAVHELPVIYSAHCVFGVFSFTNYSLLPAEIISCGGQVVDVDLENNRAVKSQFPNSHYHLASPEVESLAIQLSLRHDGVAGDKAEELRSWKASFGGWDKEFRPVGTGILGLFNR